MHSKEANGQAKQSKAVKKRVKRELRETKFERTKQATCRDIDLKFSECWLKNTLMERPFFNVQPVC